MFIAVLLCCCSPITMHELHTCDVTLRRVKTSAAFKLFHTVFFSLPNNKEKKSSLAIRDYYPICVLCPYGYGIPHTCILVRDACMHMGFDFPYVHEMMYSRRLYITIHLQVNLSTDSSVALNKRHNYTNWLYNE